MKSGIRQLFNAKKQITIGTCVISIDELLAEVTSQSTGSYSAQFSDMNSSQVCNALLSKKSYDYKDRMSVKIALDYISPAVVDLCTRHESMKGLHKVLQMLRSIRMILYGVFIPRKVRIQLVGYVLAFLHGMVHDAKANACAGHPFRKRTFTTQFFKHTIYQLNVYVTTLMATRDLGGSYQMHDDKIATETCEKNFSIVAGFGGILGCMSRDCIYATFLHSQENRLILCTYEREGGVKPARRSKNHDAERYHAGMMQFESDENWTEIDHTKLSELNNEVLIVELSKGVEGAIADLKEMGVSMADWSMLFDGKFIFGTVLEEEAKYEEEEGEGEDNLGKIVVTDESETVEEIVAADENCAEAIVTAHDIAIGEGNSNIYMLLDGKGNLVDARKIVAKLNLLHSMNQYSRDRAERVKINCQRHTKGNGQFDVSSVIACGIYVAVLFLDADGKYVPYFGRITKMTKRQNKNATRVTKPVKLAEALNDNSLLLCLDWLQADGDWKTTTKLTRVGTSDVECLNEVETKDLISCPTITAAADGTFDMNENDLNAVVTYVEFMESEKAEDEMGGESIGSGKRASDGTSSTDAKKMRKENKKKD